MFNVLLCEIMKLPREEVFYGINHLIRHVHIQIPVHTLGHIKLHVHVLSHASQYFTVTYLTYQDVIHSFRNVILLLCHI